MLVVDCVWNVMAHAQKPEFVLQRNGRVHLNRRGRQFSRLLAAEVCVSTVVMLDKPCFEVVWRVLATHSIRQFSLHLPSRASLCAITFQLDSTRASLNHGHSTGLRNVRWKRRECKERRVDVLHLVAATHLSCVPSLRAEVWATSPTLPHKTPCSRGHLKCKGQSDKVMSYPPVSSHAVDYVPATACHGDSPLTRTPHFCRSHCDSWHVHHRKEPLERNTAWVVAPIQFRYPTVHSRKSGDTPSLSSLSSCGLTSLTVAYQALMIVSASTSLGNVEWT